jgi:hypothetical protein
MVPDLPPLPLPSFIELNEDRFILDPRARAGIVEYARIDQMLAMTPAERLHWNEGWTQFIRECLHRGASAEEIEAAVYWTSAADEPR